MMPLRFRCAPSQQQRSAAGKRALVVVATHERGDRRRDGRDAPPVSVTAWPALTRLRREIKSADDADKTREPLTVYTVRLSTGIARGATLSNPNSAINVCLMGKDGAGLMTRISPVNDATDTQARLQAICEVASRGRDVGADLTTTAELLAGRSASTSGVGAAPPPPPSRQRFQAGSVDEVVLLAPEMGALSSLMIATEDGTWWLDEVDVSSSRTNHTDRFVCRRQLGSLPGLGAVCLQPVPPGYVVYGSGDTAVVLSKEQAAAVRQASMTDYEELKSRLLSTTLLLTVGGSAIGSVLGGLDVALHFAIGGLAGVMYQFLQQQSVETIISTAEAQLGTQRPARGGIAVGATSTRGALAAQRLLGSPAWRLAVITASALGALALTQPDNGTVFSASHDWAMGHAAVGQALVSLLGFSTYKLALLGIMAATPETPNAVVADARQQQQQQRMRPI